MSDCVAASDISDSEDGVRGSDSEADSIVETALMSSDLKLLRKRKNKKAKAKRRGGGARKLDSDSEFEEEEEEDEEEEEEELDEAANLGRRRKRKRVARAKIPKKAKELLAKANEAYVKQKYNNALVLIEEVIKSHPRLSPAYLLLSAIYDELGNKEKHALCLSLAARNRKEDAETWRAAGEAYEALGNEEQALYHFTRGLSVWQSVDPSRRDDDLKRSQARMMWRVKDLLVKKKDFEGAICVIRGEFADSVRNVSVPAPHGRPGEVPCQIALGDVEMGIELAKLYFQICDSASAAETLEQCVPPLGVDIPADPHALNMLCEVQLSLSDWQPVFDRLGGNLGGVLAEEGVEGTGKGWPLEFVLHWGIAAIRLKKEAQMDKALNALLSTLQGKCEDFHSSPEEPRDFSSLNEVCEVGLPFLDALMDLELFDKISILASPILSVLEVCSSEAKAGLFEEGGGVWGFLLRLGMVKYEQEKMEEAVHLWKELMIREISQDEEEDRSLVVLRPPLLASSKVLSRRERGRNRRKPDQEGSRHQGEVSSNLQPFVIALVDALRGVGEGLLAEGVLEKAGVTYREVEKNKQLRGERREKGGSSFVSRNPLKRLPHPMSMVERAKMFQRLQFMVDTHRPLLIGEQPGPAEGVLAGVGKVGAIRPERASAMRVRFCQMLLNLVEDCELDFERLYKFRSMQANEHFRPPRWPCLKSRTVDEMFGLREFLRVLRVGVKACLICGPPYSMVILDLLRLILRNRMGRVAGSRSGWLQIVKEQCETDLLEGKPGKDGKKIDPRIVKHVRIVGRVTIIDSAQLKEMKKTPSRLRAPMAGLTDFDLISYYGLPDRLRVPLRIMHSNKGREDRAKEQEEDDEEEDPDEFEDEDDGGSCVSSESEAGSDGGASMASGRAQSVASRISNSSIYTKGSYKGVGYSNWLRVELKPNPKLKKLVPTFYGVPLTLPSQAYDQRLSVRRFLKFQAESHGLTVSEFYMEEAAIGLMDLIQEAASSNGPSVHMAFSLRALGQELKLGHEEGAASVIRQLARQLFLPEEEYGVRYCPSRPQLSGLVKYLRTYRKIKTSADAEMLAGHVFMIRRSPERAAECFAAAARLDPSSSVPLLHQAAAEMLVALSRTTTNRMEKMGKAMELLKEARVKMEEGGGDLESFEAMANTARMFHSLSGCQTWATSVYLSCMQVARQRRKKVEQDIEHTNPPCPPGSRNRAGSKESLMSHRSDREKQGLDLLRKEEEEFSRATRVAALNFGSLLLSSGNEEAAGDIFREFVEF